MQLTMPQQEHWYITLFLVQSGAKVTGGFLWAWVLTRRS